MTFARAINGLSPLGLNSPPLIRRLSISPVRAGQARPFWGVRLSCSDSISGSGSLARHFSCAVKRRWSTVGKVPPGNWFAPPGSNRSSSGGNEAAEASGVEGHVGDLASL